MGGSARARGLGAGLPKDSIANISQVVTLDKAMFTERVGKLPTARLEEIVAGFLVLLGR